ncbi:immunoglobulin superfamily member 5 isoform X1 [Takifugu rubripes]|uniref:immunoglobulin superfamily member 5 isoform X1 n=1 Tax=Takifugu rubripes TaxID=31033 RepID=UPI001145FBAF|nr:immunoglobulin superfamily member 5-like isoform X1 [Takifugu rubripes]XP_011606564.2 immunoglobulin superfamily member 5-like isoform X1 [Takifugu rubripes]XP_029700138.1 immunoglobulin superfamily member 5-like isoform X1 [Takifugu rubripes]
MNVLSFWMLLLSSSIEATMAQVTLTPETLTVLRGDEARLTCCSSSSQWTVMVWLLNAEVVLTISNESGLLPSINPNVTAEQISPNSWTFILKNTTRLNQGRVTCDLQGIDRKAADLFVQEKGRVQIFGEDKLAFRGHSVLFECKAAGWYPQPQIQWQVKGKQVSQSDYNVTAGEAVNSVFTVTSSLLLTATMTSRVDCLASVSALSQPLKSSVSLTVVTEVLQEDNCSVSLVVVASMLALLLLLNCTGCVLYYTQRRHAKRSSEDAFRLDQSGRGTDLVAEATEGSVNLGYSCGGSTDVCYTNTIILETGGQNASSMEFSTFTKVPDVVSSSSQSLHTHNQECPSEENSKNVRRITTV